MNVKLVGKVSYNLAKSGHTGRRHHHGRRRRRRHRGGRRASKAASAVSKALYTKIDLL